MSRLAAHSRGAIRAQLLYPNITLLAPIALWAAARQAL
jgi:hypothetical protein